MVVLGCAGGLEIQWRDLSATAGSLDLRMHSFEFLDGATNEDHACTVAGGSQCDSTTDAATGSGDGNNAPGQFIAGGYVLLHRQR